MPAKYSVLGMQNFHPLLLIIRVLNEHKLEVKLENWSIVELSEFDYCQNCGAQLFGNENISTTCPPSATPFSALLVESNTAKTLIIGPDWAQTLRLCLQRLYQRSTTRFCGYNLNQMNNFLTLVNSTHNKPDFFPQIQ